MLAPQISAKEFKEGEICKNFTLNLKLISDEAR
jgi:hypothetical protein